ncbi:MAG: HAD-IA family hydrolase [Alphaproteobacteria bacterium]
MRQQPIVGVVFDVGRVLVEVSYDAIANRLSRHSTMTANQIRDHLLGGDLERESESGAYDSHEYFRRVKQHINGSDDWSYDQFVAEVSAGLEMTAEGEEALHFASQRARVFLMSNTGYLHALWIYGQEVLATLPEQHFFSFREGIMKPDPRLWDIFFARTGLTAEQCLFIDDRPENCQGAERLGVRVANFRIGQGSLLDVLKQKLPG